MTKVNLHNENETKSDIFTWDISKSDTCFYQNMKIFQGLAKSKFLNFLTKVNPNNGNEIKSDLFPRDIFKSTKEHI